MFTIRRSEHNPLLSPNHTHPWEAAGAFNGSPVVHDKKVYLTYRALSEPERLKEPHIRTSIIGVAEATDKGEHFGPTRPLVVPSEEFDKFGCEDPRPTKIGDTTYIFYTGLGGYPFGPDNIRVCVAKTRDMKNVDEKHLVTPFNAKAMTLFPEKVNGKFAAILTTNTDTPPSEICYVEFDKEEDMWSPDFWNTWKENMEAHKIQIRRQGSDQLEVGAQPVKTPHGWLLVYSHIQRYGSPDVVFGIEAVLLDLKNPRTVIGRTKGPFMVNEEYYENTGLVPNIVFPSGALLRKTKEANLLDIYYGAADTHCAKATVNVDDLIKTITHEEKPLVKRMPGNPIITPRPKVDWEVRGTFNPAAIYLDDKFHILYRAVSDKNVSTVGYATSADGYSIDTRSKKPIYVPREGFEKNGDSNYGCEDPRIMLIGDRIYMTYTGYNGATPRVAISSIAVDDFLKGKWEKWDKPYAITPEGVDNKDACLIPEAVDGKYLIFHRVDNHICAFPLQSLDFSKEKVNLCIDILGPRRGMWDGIKVGIAAPPIKTKAGWLLLYHGVSWSSTYRVGAVLLDLKDPTAVLARTAVPLFEPKEDYERNGIVPRVVFPCGVANKGDKVFMYYGGGDLVVGGATFSLKEILKRLTD